MPIRVDEQTQTFTLYTDTTSYQMQVDQFGYLLHLYYGRRSAGQLSYLVNRFDRGTSAVPHESADDRTHSLDFLPQEFPVQGTGDMRNTALVVRDSEGAFGCDLRYVGYEIREGKYSLEGLPAAYAEEGDDATTLRIVLQDRRLGLRVDLLYAILPHLDIICRAAEVKNEGNAPIVLEKLQSACLDMVSGHYDLISFSGRHAMERTFERRPVDHISYVAQSRRGASSHQINPLLILADHDTTEDAGRCWAMSFVYSGAFKAEALRDQYEQTRLQLGLDDELFSYPLAPQEKLVAPEVIMSYSYRGLDQLSYNLHRCLRTRVCRGYWRDRDRPILINSWEAFYYDFDGDQLVKLAKKAHSLGIELLVLDDGWFGKRNDDKHALGDWWVNEDKLQGTLAQLVAAINDVGMKFGIWMEPEMVSEDSALYQEHPDWALAIPHKPPVLGRNQLVLDLSRQEVQDNIFAQMCAVLDQAPIDYLKWDFNRVITDVYSHVASDQGKVLYDYVHGLYALLERVVQRYPRLLIEGCAGGGGRFDAGMLYYTPQIWCSDNTDAIDRLSIQYGTSFGYPLSAMSAHVSASPNEVNGRVTPLDTRATVAQTGAFGYELDLDKLSAEEQDSIAEQVRSQKRRAALIREGRYHRLSKPFAGPVCAFSFVSEDKSQVLVSAVITEVHGFGEAHYVRLRGLEDDTLYRDTKTGALYSSGALMDMGLQLPIENGLYRSYSYVLEKV